MNTDTDNKPLYSIGTVARMFGISVQTLRLYESNGLILPHKSPGGQRLYTEADLERLRCIRRAITEDKIGIAGIRRMQSLVPCWRYVDCSTEEQSRCPSYAEHAAGCWTYRHGDNACHGRDCRLCEVYILATTCAGIKQMIQHSTQP